MSAALVLGPLLRYVGTRHATVWVEADRACEVEVLGARRRTFHVAGHHYALVVIDDLTPGAATPYEVRLDGQRVWPLDDGRPAPRIVTRAGEPEARLVFGSCRAGAPHRPPYTLTAAEHPEGLGIDALWAYSRRLQAEIEPWPDCLLLLGDQMYADELSPGAAARARARGTRPGGPPDDEAADFEEYTGLYRESWSDPEIRWLLSTVPSTMVFDDHDVRDDWNISDAWVRDMRALPWWDDRIAGAFMAYWIYQHIGNLAPPELPGERLLADVYDDEDAAPRLRRFALAADRDTTSSRFAFHRDFARTRLVVIDARAARVLEPGRRDIVDADEWRWISERTEGDFDHLILATTVPVFMAHGIHHVEAWNERLCDGAWGRPGRRLGERLRRAFDFDHWPAFQRSFRGMIALLRDRAAPSDGVSAPATIMVIGGDVHTAYLAEVDLGAPQDSRVYQLVCSPFRKPLGPRERRVVRVLFSRAGAVVGRTLARLAGVRPTGARWRIVSGPTFHNSIGLIDVDGRAARMTIRRSGPGDGSGPELVAVQEAVLSPARAAEG